MHYRTKKRFGQHFLHDPMVIQKIIEAINPQTNETIVEIGPGLGAITLPLLKTGVSLQAIELDRDIIPQLKESTRDYDTLTIHQANALKFDFRSLADKDKKLRLVGNLPYNISTPLLFHFLTQRDVIADMHFMLQKEVVDRMAAQPGNKIYGRLTVMLAAACTVEPLFDISRDAFSPPPKVESAFVRLTPHRIPQFPIDNPTHFAKLVNQAFSRRRKTLRNALSGMVTPEAITRLGLDPQQRPETVSPVEFAQLSNFSNENTL